MFEIHTLKLGEILIPEGTGVLRDPIHAWLVTDGHTRILVDVGQPDAEVTKRRLGVEARGGGPEALTNTLAEHGIRPEQIDIIIVTHLHFDHAWNLDLFPRARVIVQRDELFHAIDPVPTQRIFYLRDTTAALLSRKRPAQLELIDGDMALLTGIDLMKVPGHTPGMQVPIVTTERGKVALVSDLGDHYRSWFPADPRATDHPLRYLAGSFLPGVIRSESERTYQDSMARVSAAADIVVPAHDFRIPIHMPSDWFEVPDSTDGDFTRPPAAAE
jgi:glyoxylase-like metal-dependent hydrolase (beta-lactamase superfamily II)